MLFLCLGHQAEKDLLKRFETNQYSQQEITVLSVPFTLPYPVHERDFASADGEFEYQGHHYKLVKQKLENDTLFLMCIHDKVAERIATVMASYSVSAHESTSATSTPADHSGKLFKDFKSSETIELYLNKECYETLFVARAAVYECCENMAVDSPPPEIAYPMLVPPGGYLS